MTPHRSLATAALTLAIALSVSCSAAPDSELAQFEWLLGNWVATQGDTRITEHWAAAGPRTFEGHGTTQTSKRTSTESQRLAVMQGDVFYIAKVAHNELPAAFRLDQASTPGHAIFVNPEHDFPKRIEYRFDAPDDLLVMVSDGQAEGFEIQFKRCSSNACE